MYKIRQLNQHEQQGWLSQIQAKKHKKCRSYDKQPSPASSMRVSAISIFQQEKQNSAFLERTRFPKRHDTFLTH